MPHPEVVRLLSELSHRIRRVAVISGREDVLRRLVESSDAREVLYTGDDRTDIDAFRALRRLAARGVKKIAVGVASSEMPSSRCADCDLVVEGANSVGALLADLCRTVGA